jgi:uncharacterized protein (DUF1015 family)
MSEPGRDIRARPLQLMPFPALRYSPEAVPDLAAVTCPPYDVIGENGVAAWESADPYNVVRLILPRPDPKEDKYAHAAHDLRSWLEQGVLSRDPAPALYVYEHATDTETTLGLVGAVSLHDPDERVVLPHEDVFPGPVADRAALMAATGAQLEPILLTYGGGGRASTAVDGVLTTMPTIMAETPDGASHRIWRVTEPSILAGIRADLGGRQLLIADGHHRYAAYLALRDLVNRADHRTRFTADVARAAQHGLAMVVDADRHPLRLGSIHRSIAGLSLAQASAAARRGFAAVAPLPPDLHATTAPTRAGDEAAFVISDGRHGVLLQHPIRELLEVSLPAGHSPTWRRLDASIACEFVLPTLFGVDDADGRVAYHHDVADALSRARRVGGIALLIKPASLGDVLAVAANGERMPRKSTSFGPKPRTGLLMRLLADPVATQPEPTAARR